MVTQTMKFNDATVAIVKQLMAATVPETTQEKLAAASGVKLHTLQRYLTDRPSAPGDRYGRMPLRLDHLEQIAQAFGFTLLEVVRRAEDLTQSGVPSLRPVTTPKVAGSTLTAEQRSQFEATANSLGLSDVEPDVSSGQTEPGIDSSPKGGRRRKA